MARNSGQRNGARSELLGNMAAKHSKEMYGRNKTKKNRASSGLPGTSAAIRSSSWWFLRLFWLVAFYQQMLLALLFIDVYFRSKSFLQVDMSQSCSSASSLYNISTKNHPNFSKTSRSKACSIDISSPFLVFAIFLNSGLYLTINMVVFDYSIFPNNMSPESRSLCKPAVKIIAWPRECKSHETAMS